MTAPPPEGPTPARRALSVIGTLVAPTTLVTALLIYFGTLYAYWYFVYFGVNASVLDLGPTDYLVRSADSLFVPVLAAATLALVALTVHSRARGRPLTRRGVIWIRRGGTACAAVSVLALGLAGREFARPDLTAPAPWLRGLALALGAVGLASAGRLRATGRAVAERPSVLGAAAWAAWFTLVSVGLFWAAGDYSSAAGTGRAHTDLVNIATVPDVTVYSEKRLSLRGQGIVETLCTSPDHAYAVRYDGLKLVIRSGDQYVLLPVGWRPADGVAILLRRSDALRFEFSRAGPPRSYGC